MSDDTMHNSTRGHLGAAQRCGLLAAAALAIGALMPATAAAQAAQPTPAPGDWRYAATVYLYLPSVSGSSSFPTPGNGTPINITAEQLLDHLKFAAMGGFEASNGTWGAFTDLIYLNFGASKSASREFTIGNIGLPANTTADFDADLKGTVWTIAGQYQLPAMDPSLTVNLLAGTRMLKLRETLNWTISGSLGPIDPAARSGSSELSDTVWDAIIGVKGRYVFGGNRQWAVPFYLDVGTGQSQNTFQAAGGISYAFQWGEVNALWRYLSYNFKSTRAIEDVAFSGPQIGVVFRW
jgi:hypothetical protein